MKSQAKCGIPERMEKMRETAPEQDLISRRSIAFSYIQGKTTLRDCISGLGGVIREIGKELPENIYEKVRDGLWIARDAKVSDSAVIEGDAIICQGSRIYPGSAISGNAVIGSHVRVGVGCEIRNTICFDLSEIGNGCFIDSSIIGYKASVMPNCVVYAYLPEGRNETQKRDRYGVPMSSARSHFYGSVIGDCTVIEPFSLIKPNSHIGAFSKVTAYSEFVGDLPPYKVYKNQTVMPTIRAEEIMI